MELSEGSCIKWGYIKKSQSFRKIVVCFGYLANPNSSPCWTIKKPEKSRVLGVAPKKANQTRGQSVDYPTSNEI